MNRNAQVFDTLDQDFGTRFVDLSRHQSRRKLDDVRLQSQVIGSLGGFKTKQSTTDHGTAFGLFGVLNDVLKVFDGSVDKNAGFVDAGNGRNERIRSRRHDDFVIGNLDAFGGSNDFVFSIDLGRAITDMNFDANLFVPVHPRQHQLFCIAVRKEAGQTDAVISRPWFFAECDDSIVLGIVKRNELFAETQTNHTVANNNDCLFIIRDHDVVRDCQLNQIRLGNQLYEYGATERLSLSNSSSRDV